MATEATPLNLAALGVTESEPALFQEPGPRWRRLACFVRSTAVTRLRALAAWSHTRRALWLGTAVTALLGLATAGALVLIGFVGVGTHSIPAIFGPPPPADSGAAVGPQPPDPSIFSLPLPALLPPAPPLGPALGDKLARLVLQPDDLASVFTVLDKGPTGGDVTTDLSASYHAVYQRPASESDSGGDSPIAVTSQVSVYRTAQAASFRLSDVNLSRLAIQAGVPGLNSETVPARTVGEESRVAHLTGNDAGVNIGVYLIQFRRGSTNAIVGVAAVLGSESLDEALGLADKEDAHIIAAALPVLR